MYRRALLLVLIDIFLLTASFLFWIWLKPATLRIYLPNYFKPFLVFLVAWTASSIITDKYIVTPRIRLIQLNKNIVYGNFLALAFISIFMFMVRMQFFSRQVVFGTVFLATILELIIIDVFYLLRKAKDYSPEIDIPLVFEHPKPKTEIEETFPQISPERVTYTDSIKKYITQECGMEVFSFIQETIDPFYPKTLILSTTTKFNVDKQPDN